MGLLSGLLGNASTIDPAQLADELEPILAAEETIEVAKHSVTARGSSSPC